MNTQYMKVYPIPKLTKEEIGDLLKIVDKRYEKTKHKDHYVEEDFSHIGLFMQETNQYSYGYIFWYALNEYYPNIAGNIHHKYNCSRRNNFLDTLMYLTSKGPKDYIFPIEAEWRWDTIGALPDVALTPRTVEYYNGWGRQELLWEEEAMWYKKQIKGKHERRRGKNTTVILQEQEHFPGCNRLS